jgi:hypothetical protein
MTPSGIEPVTFRFVAQYLNQGATISGPHIYIYKVAGSIPDGIIGIFHWHNPSDRTMALGVDLAANRNE